MADKVFEYNGNHITFQLGNGDTMVNATEMAKPFGKRVQHFLNTEQTKEFLKVLSQSRNLGFEQLMVTKKGGNTAGTWMHEDLALVFAQWLSPKFYLWCNDRLKELMKYGFTATDQTLDRLIAQPELGVELFTALKEERERHAEELEREQSISNNLFDLSLFQTKYIADLEQESLLNKLAARRYLNIANEQQSILKQMGIPIPTNLKISRRVYAANILRLRS